MISFDFRTRGADHQINASAAAAAAAAAAGGGSFWWLQRVYSTGGTTVTLHVLV